MIHVSAYCLQFSFTLVVDRCTVICNQVFLVGEGYYCTIVCDHRNLVLLCGFLDPVYIVPCGPRAVGYIVVLTILRNVTVPWC